MIGRRPAEGRSSRWRPGAFPRLPFLPPSGRRVLPQCPSKKRSGISFCRKSKPVPLGMAAVMPTIFELALPSWRDFEHALIFRRGSGLAFGEAPVFRSKGPDPCHFRVPPKRWGTFSFLGKQVEHDRFVGCLGELKEPGHGIYAVSVDWSEVANTQFFENTRGANNSLVSLLALDKNF